MKTNAYKVVIALFVALLQYPVAFSTTNATTSVPLYYRHNPPVVNGTSGPHKNPPHQITLEKNGGIKSVGNPTPERLIVALETPAPAMATLLVTSVLDGTCVISCPVAEGTENVSLDTSRLSRGVYVVSYSVNSELIDQKKVRLD